MAHPNYRLVKRHYSYEVAEAAGLLNVHRNTVRHWIRQGLPVIDDRRPILIPGKSLQEFLLAKRAKAKRPCRPGEIYCLRCRVPRRPAGDIAEYQPTTDTLGVLIGICPTCDALMYRRTSRARLDVAGADLEITETPKSATQPRSGGGT